MHTHHDGESGAADRKVLHDVEKKSYNLIINVNPFGEESIYRLVYFDHRSLQSCIMRN